MEHHRSVAARTVMDVREYVVTARLPLQTFWFDDACRYVLDTSAIESLLACLPEVLPKLDSHLSRIAAGFEDPPDKLADFLKERNRSRAWKLHKCISITALVSVDVETLRADNNGMEFDADTVMSIAALFLAGAIEKLLLISEIAYPGGVDALAGTTIVNDRIAQPIKEKGAFRTLHYPEPEDSCWPPVSHIGLSAVVDWLGRTGFLSGGLAITRIQRVLAAYTHVIGLTSQREGEVLFRAMQGLEAFYCEGTGDLRKQLAEKVELWLGPWKKKKNIVGHLYDLRSKFVHGSAHLEYWNNYDDVWEENEKGMTDFSAAVIFAVRLLIASLQRCVQDGVTDFRWRYAIETLG